MGWWTSHKYLKIQNVHLLTMLDELHDIFYSLSHLQTNQDNWQSTPTKCTCRELFTQRQITFRLDQTHRVQLFQQLFRGFSSKRILWVQLFDLVCQRSNQSAKFVILRVVLSFFVCGTFARFWLLGGYYRSSKIWSRLFWGVFAREILVSVPFSLVRVPNKRWFWSHMLRNNMIISNIIRPQSLSLKLWPWSFMLTLSVPVSKYVVLSWSRSWRCERYYGKRAWNC